MEQLRKFQFSPKVLEYLGTIERFQGYWQGQERSLNPATTQKLKKTTIITSSGSSTRIEGALLSDDEVAKLIERGCQITKMSSRSEREVAGYAKCLNYIYKEYKKLPISEHTIKELHQLLTADLSNDQLPKSQRGAYKNVPNDVVEKNRVTGEAKLWFRTTPPGPLTSTAMSKLIADYNILKTEGVPNLILTGAFVVQFLAIHPFRDGNGRLSRLLTLLLFLKDGYSWVQFVSHEKFIEDNKESYYISLRNTQATFLKSVYDYRPWIEFFLQIICRQAEFLKGEIENQETIHASLNENERKVFEVIKKSGTCGISFIEKQLDMSREGLKDLLARLVAQGYLTRKGEKKGTKYQVRES